MSTQLVALHLTALTDDEGPVRIDDRTWAFSNTGEAMTEADRLTRNRTYSRSVGVHGVGFGIPTE